MLFGITLLGGGVYGFGSFVAGNWQKSSMNSEMAALAQDLQTEYPHVYAVESPYWPTMLAGSVPTRADKAAVAERVRQRMGDKINPHRAVRRVMVGNPTSQPSVSS